MDEKPKLRSVLRARLGLAALAGIALVIGVLPTGHAAREKSQPPALTALTTITGNRTVSQTVRLPTAVHLREASLRGIRGDGRIVGFILSKIDQGTPLGKGPTLFGWRLGRCMKKGCAAKGFTLSWLLWENAESRDGEDILPRGRYRLFLIADGGPARVKLQLGGLQGERTISPENPVESSMISLRPKVRHEGGESLYWTGTASELKGPGFALSELWVDGPQVQGSAGTCIYTKTSPPPDNLAYVPPCPTADLFDANVISADHNEIGFYDFGLPRAMGLWRTVPQEPKRAGAVALWLKF